MFAVIFEVEPKPERRDDYLAIAGDLKPKLQAIDGFIDVDRFESRRTPGRLLSLSIWRDEKALIRWRTHAEHHDAQEQGRFAIFADYRLRVGEITSDTEGSRPVQQRFDETECGPAKVATITELLPRQGELAAAPEKRLSQLRLNLEAAGLVDHDVFESIYTPGKLALLVSWRDAAAAESWRPAAPNGAAIRHRHVRIIRDYGMFERREAPQYYPGVAAVQLEPKRAAAR